MTDVEPLETFNLDKNQQQVFVRYYNNLPEKTASTVRFFNHSDFYTVHHEDASLAVDTVCSSNIIKYMGLEPKLSYVVLSKSNFNIFLRELLLIKQYRAEVYIRVSPQRVNEWKLEYKGSPGNLTQFEDIIFENCGNVVVNSCVMAVNPLKNRVLAIGCVNTTEFKFSLCELTDNEFYTELEALIAQKSPKECVIPSGESPELVTLNTILTRNGILVLKQKRSNFNTGEIEQDLNRLLYFYDGQQRNSKTLTEKFQNVTLGSLQAAIKYLDLTNDEQNFNQFRLDALDIHKYVRLDSAALSALNLLPEHDKEGPSSYKSVFEVFDCCVTTQGRRLLAQWLKQPLRDLNLISDRLEVVETIVKDTEMRSTLRTACLTRVPDMIMLSKKLSNKKINLEDCYKIYLFVSNVSGLLSVLKDSSNKCVKTMLIEPIADLVSDMDKYQLMIEQTLDMDLVERQEYFIKPTFDDASFGDLRRRKERIEERMQKALKSAASHLGVDAGKTVKLECTDHRGYFYRITLKEESLLRDTNKYTVIEAIKGGVRFYDSTLKELNDEYTEISEQYLEAQEDVVKELLDVAAGYADTLRSLNMSIAQVDVLTAFAHTATSAPGIYIKPKLLPEGSGVLRLLKARHPCLEKHDNLSYIPNSVEFKSGETILNIITGPNMGGKSTYMKSVALCVLLAHVGSFVPCQEAEISLVDCILTRVGSSDCELKGMSTFMMEMVETCNIVRSATSNSLVIIDELGRGTSTYDGCSIAWSIAEYLIKEIKSYSLFATHFHEITNLATLFSEVENLHVSVVETEDTMTPLYQVRKGVCDKSYGIHCAKILKFPKTFIKVAEDHQNSLEFSEGMKYINDFEFSLKRKMIKDGDELINETLKKYKNMDIENISDDKFTQIQNLKKELLASDNLFFKGLLESCQ